MHGVLSANLLGFHTHDYSRHFQSAATRIIGAQCSNEQIKLNGSVSQLGTFPIGIDPQKFVDSLQTDSGKKHLEELKKQFDGRHVLLGIDRLDYIKGIATKITLTGIILRQTSGIRGESCPSTNCHPITHRCCGISAIANPDSRIGWSY